MVRQSALALAVLGLAACSSTGTGSAAHLVPTVVSVTPEDANHVAVVSTWHNPTATAEADICDIVVNDQAGTQIGDKVDGPADKVAPGQTLTIRDVIKTSVTTDNVGNATFTACRSQ